MKRQFPELNRLRIKVSEEARRRHQAAVAAELRNVPVRRRRPRRLLAVAVALALLIPTAAIAAEDSLPGDALYPVKVILEPVRAVFDGDVVARHRVAELEDLVDSREVDSVSDESVDRARDAVREIETPELRQRLDRVIDRLTENEEVSSPSDAPAADRRPVTDRPPSESVSTTTSEAPNDRAGDQVRPTTTTSNPETDRPPSDG